MTPTDEQKRFLGYVGSLNECFNAIRVDERTESLSHCFWSADVVADAESVKAQWDIPEHLLPFYGDWHDVLCLDLRSGAVLMLDDSRAVVYRWADHNRFLDALQNVEEKPVGKLGVIKDESRLDF